MIWINAHTFANADEEVGGDRGMATFLKASEFMDMNVSLALDEGAATMDDVYPIFYGERSVFRKLRTYFIFIV